ncbi:P1 family peptidase [Streptomyces bobili]|uniref:P1 family peptidase n=1 Tax=Streptomyces bobili TaxID=67280 RepID=UPI0036F0ED5C
MGAGTGATAGPVKGGIGTASTVLDSGVTVAPLVAANAAGRPWNPGPGRCTGSCRRGG